MTRASKNGRPRQNAPLGVMLNFDVRVKNSDAAQLRLTNVKTPNATLLFWKSPQKSKQTKIHTIFKTKLGFESPLKLDNFKKSDVL